MACASPGNWFRATVREFWGPITGARSRREPHTNLDLAPRTGSLAKRGTAEGGPEGLLKARGPSQEPNFLVPVSIA